jgi:uncharacterized protein YndB with AHSA1/START domain
MSAPQSAVATASTADREIIVTRVFDAPRELVFDAFTAPERVAPWWGPRGFTTTTYEMDPRPGGIWRFTMHGPDGTDYPNLVEYREVVRPERLEYHHGSGAEGDAGFEVTVSFVEEAAGTRVTLHTVVPSAEERQRFVEFGAVEGGQQTLERLGEYLASR